jgi:Domain of Unknown Function (DUF1080)
LIFMICCIAPGSYYTRYPLVLQPDTGRNYQERGRTFLAVRGQTVRLDRAKPVIIATLGDPKTLESYIKNDDWNEYHIIVRGDVLIHILNGHVMSVVIDEDVKNRRFDGLVGLQVHVGPPMNRVPQLSFEETAGGRHHKR